MTDINYFDVTVPDGKNPSEYHWTERRAEILQMILTNGTPRGISQYQLADRYDVSQPQINQDFDALSDCASKRIGDTAKLQTRAAFEKIFKDLVEGGGGEEPDWRAKKAAWDMMMDFNEWLGDIGEQDRAPKKSEVDIDADVRSRHAELAYHVEHTVDTESADIEFDGLDVDGFTATPPEEN